MSVPKVGMLMVPCTDGVLFGMEHGGKFLLQGLPKGACVNMSRAIRLFKAGKGKAPMEQTMDRAVTELAVEG